MRRTIALAAVTLAAALVACNDKSSGTTGGPESQPTTTSAATTATAVTTAAMTATPTATAEAVVSATPTATAVATTTPVASSTAAAGAKTFDCGAKGQKPCPMQGWMKSVMANAVSSGDGAKIASGLSTIASKPVPGFGNWSSIASAGAAKAKANDIDGAKAACKQCHDAYKAKYVATMRDRPW